MPPSRSALRGGLTLSLTLATLAAAIVLSLLIGAAPIGVPVVLWSLAHPAASGIDARIVWEIRLPRVCIGAVVGGALGLAGALLQTLLSNPLADPYITGVSAGAGVAIALAIAGGVAMPFVPALGFAAGIASAALVLALSIRAGRIDSQRLVLAGIFVSAFFSAIVMIVLSRLQPGGAQAAIIAWLAGTLAGHGWSDLAWSLPYAIVGVVLAIVATPGLGAMRLGEERAASVGVDVGRTQWIVLAASSLLTAAAVALSGLIAFIGLLSPHVARRIAGSDIRLLAPLSAIVGAIGITAADAAARTLARPGELPIGALIALFGVPAFLFILFRERASSGLPIAAADLSPLDAVRAALRRLRGRTV